MNLLLNGRTYVLSPRRAADVLELAHAAEKMGGSGIDDLMTLAQAVSDSLRATGLSLDPVRRFKYRPFVRKRGVMLLLDGLSTAQLGAAYMGVVELEGGKKKREEMERELAGK